MVVKLSNKVLINWGVYAKGAQAVTLVFACSFTAATYALTVSVKSTTLDATLYIGSSKTGTRTLASIEYKSPNSAGYDGGYWTAIGY